MKTRIRKSCFTLLEVLVSMGVFAILMLALMQFFVSAQGVLERTGSKTEFYDNSRIAMNLLSNDLMSTFYAWEYDGSQYTFMVYNNSDKTKITFATLRSDGLAEVYYFWDTADLKLKLKTLKECDTTDFSHWVTRPNSGWDSTSGVQGTGITPVVIAENVVDFEVKIYKLNSSNIVEPINEPLPTTDGIKIPYMVEIKMIIMDNMTIEKLKAMSLTNIKDTYDKYISGTTLTDVQRDIITSGTQTFKRIVLINRGQF